MSRGPELLRVFNSRRGHQRTQKARKPLAAGDPTGGAYITPPDPLDVLKGPSQPASKGKEGEGRGWERVGKEKEKGKGMAGR